MDLRPVDRLVLWTYDCGPTFDRAASSNKKEAGEGLAQRTQILVVESEQLLAASIVSLLASRSEFDVTNSTFASLAIMDEPNSPQPDIVILEKAHLMANMSAVVKLADRHPNLRLIIFGLSDNTLQVFDKQMVEVRQVSDFLELL